MSKSDKKSIMKFIETNSKKLDLIQTGSVNAQSRHADPEMITITLPLKLA